MSPTPIDSASRATDEQGRWKVAPGDPTCVFVPSVAKPINAGSQKAAALIVLAVNAHLRLPAEPRAFSEMETHLMAQSTTRLQYIWKLEEALRTIANADRAYPDKKIADDMQYCAKTALALTKEGSL